VADDIDHLSNRRIRSVGELVQNKFRVGLMRTDRIAKDRMTVMDLETVTPTQLVNSGYNRGTKGILRQFTAFTIHGSDNPLAELAHKRRISAMVREAFPARGHRLTSATCILHIMDAFARCKLLKVRTSVLSCIWPLTLV